MLWLPKYLKTVPSFMLFLFFYKFSDSPSSHSDYQVNPEISTVENGEFCVIMNALSRNRFQSIDESISDIHLLTFVTQTSLDRLQPLVDLTTTNQWTAPVSAAVFVPYSNLVQAIHLLHRLYAIVPNFADYTSLHLFWPNQRNDSECHLPFTRTVSDNCPKFDVKCLIRELETLVDVDKNRLYPVNVARNIARSSVPTRFELVADVELVPSRNASYTLQAFLREQQKRPVVKEVFVMPVFEIDRKVGRLPDTVADLGSLLIHSTAVPFHFFKAPECHQIPQLLEWLRSPVDRGVAVASTSRWIRPCWEPVFVARTALTPAYDGSFRGYGKNKIEQVYEMCRADFQFHVLSNVFLMHRNISVMDSAHYNKIKHILAYNNLRYEQFRRQLDKQYTNQTVTDYCDQSGTLNIDTRQFMVHSSLGLVH